MIPLKPEFNSVKREETAKEMISVMNHTVSSPDRNWYCCEINSPENDIWMTLCLLNLAKPGKIINYGKDIYFHLTNLGMMAIGKSKYVAELKLERESL